MRDSIGRVGPGAVIGDIAMFIGEPYISSSRAVDRVTAFRFDRDRLLPELAHIPISVPPLLNMSPPLVNFV